MQFCLPTYFMSGLALSIYDLQFISLGFIFARSTVNIALLILDRVDLAHL